MSADLLPQFLADFDQVRRSIDARYDLRGSDLADLICLAFDGSGVLSIESRRPYAHRVQAQTLEAIEIEVKRCLERSGGEASEERSPSK